MVLSLTTDEALRLLAAVSSRLLFVVGLGQRLSLVDARSAAAVSSRLLYVVGLGQRLLSLDARLERGSYSKQLLGLIIIIIMKNFNRPA